MERNTRSIIPPSQMNSNKPRNTISPREMNSNYSSYNHQSHYNSYNQQNHQPQQHHSSSNHHSSSHPPPPYHPNSELINFVSSAWKEKVASDKTEYFKSENTTEKVNVNFDLEGWLNAKMRNS